jgi:hypothetical protein
MLPLFQKAVPVLAVPIADLLEASPLSHQKTCLDRVRFRKQIEEILSPGDPWRADRLESHDERQLMTLTTMLKATKIIERMQAYQRNKSDMN